MTELQKKKKVFDEIYWTLKYINNYARGGWKPLNIKREARKLISSIDNIMEDAQNV